MKLYKSEVTEMCGNCMKENTFIWDVDTDGYEAYCPSCGEPLTLCDACLHAGDNPGRKCTEDCFRQAKTGYQYKHIERITELIEKVKQHLSSTEKIDMKFLDNTYGL